jgi:hypothetical protein
LVIVAARVLIDRKTHIAMMPGITEQIGHRPHETARVDKTVSKITILNCHFDLGMCLLCTLKRLIKKGRERSLTKRLCEPDAGAQATYIQDVSDQRLQALRQMFNGLRVATARDWASSH